MYVFMDEDFLEPDHPIHTEWQRFIEFITEILNLLKLFFIP